MTEQSRTTFTRSNEYERIYVNKRANTDVTTAAQVWASIAPVSFDRVMCEQYPFLGTNVTTVSGTQTPIVQTRMNAYNASDGVPIRLWTRADRHGSEMSMVTITR